jgi:hypothetical protein
MTNPEKLSGDLAQGSMACECGFSREVCATNPCMRKKVHLAGLTPGSKWPEGAPIGEAQNTDREVWRGPDEGCGDYYADSVHVTQEGGIGINVGGHVIVMPAFEWHALATGATRARSPAARGDVERLRNALIDITKRETALRMGGPAPEDLEELSNALDTVVRIAANALDATDSLHPAASATQEPAAPFCFRRYVNGVEMAEGVEIVQASTVQDAFAKARALYGRPAGMDLVLEHATPVQSQPASGYNATQRELEILELRKELAEWKQAASVEAGLRREFADQVEQAAAIVLEPVSIPRQVFWCNGQKCQSGDGDTEFVTVREVEAAFRAKAEKIRASIASTDGDAA